MFNIETKIPDIPCSDKGIWTNPETHTFARMFEHVEMCHYFCEMIGCFCGHPPKTDTEEDLKESVDKLVKSIRKTIRLEAEDKSLSESMFAEIVDSFFEKINYEEVALAWIKNDLDPLLNRKSQITENPKS